MIRRVETIGDCTLYLGDCLEVMASFPSCFRVNAIVTDPPYGVGFKYSSHDDRPDAYAGGYGAWLWDRLSVAEAHCQPGSPVFVWQAGPNLKRFNEFFPRDWRLYVAAKNFVQMRPTAMQFSFDPVAVWWTPGAKPWSAGTATRDFHIANTAPVVATPENLEKGHPCPRPLDQVMHILEQWVPPKATVFDLFAGSGTTGVAAARTGRKFIGIEIDEGYFDIACERIRKAYAQPDMFIEQAKAPEPKQEAML